MYHHLSSVSQQLFQIPGLNLVTLGLRFLIYDNKVIRFTQFISVVLNYCINYDNWVHVLKLVWTAAEAMKFIGRSEAQTQITNLDVM